jgi:hypothetical protein
MAKDPQPAPPIPFKQGSAPMPKGCVCDPFDYAALGHMLHCPCFTRTFEIATPEFRDHAGLPGGTFDFPPDRYRKD